MDHEPILVDQAIWHQRVYKIGASSDQDVLTGLLHQPGYFLRDILFDQDRIVPLEGLFQTRRNDVLGEVVHPVGKVIITSPGWSGSSETLIAHPPQQEGVARKLFIALILAHLFVPELEVPLIRCFYDAIQ